MSLNRTRFTIATGWFLAVAVLFSVRIALGVPVTLVESAGLLLVGGLPAIVLFSVFRGAPPQTIGQVLYDTEHPVPVGGSQADAGRNNTADVR